MNYIEFFKKSVKNNANKIALVHNAKKISYKELDILSSKIAHKLHSLGAKNGGFIAINLPRSIEYVAAYLGILKAGLAVVPLNTQYPRQRVDFILNESKAFLEIKSEFFENIDEFEFYENLGADDAPALLIYTSGSTNLPKGVLHTNKDISSAVKRSLPMLKSFENSIYGSILQFSFVGFVVDFLCGFCINNEIHIIPDDVRISPELLNKYYKKHKVKSGMLPPALLKLFKEKPALKVLYAASERLSGVYYNDIEFFNFYGMSESVGLVSSFKINKKYDNTPIGKGSKEARVLVLDENNKECKSGQIGQIVIQGDFNTKYFNDEEKSKETFIKQGAKTLILTGDLGYKDENDDVVVTGRKDWMVKIHGQRVEIFEIEAALNKIKNVKECAVKAFGEFDKYLVGFVVGENLSTEILQSELAKILPNYMIPRYFVFMDALPKNLNGKLDRKALNEPNKDEISTKKDFIAPKSADEIELCEIFESVLKCGKVGLDDDFILLGGDSLGAAVIASKSKLKGINPSLILKEKTPANIIKASKTLKSLDNDNEKNKLNPSQLSVVMAHSNDDLTYNIPFYLKLPKNIDIKKFESALNSAFLSHKIFSSKITNDEMLYKKQDLKLEFQKIQSLKSFISSFVKPFDLENSVLYRFCLCELKGEYYFFGDIHHSIFDGSSIKIFLNDIADFYDGKKSKIKPEAFAFSKNYLELLENRQKDSFKHEILNINSAPISDIFDENKNEEFCLEKSLNNSEKIKEFLRANKLGTDSFFASVFGLTLMKFNAENECEFLLSNKGRHHKDLQNCVGMFVETFALHFNMPKTDILKTLCATKDEYSAHSSYLSKIAFNDVKVAFVYQDDLIDDIKLGGQNVEINTINVKHKNLDLLLMLTKKNGNFEFSLTYNNLLYSKWLMEQFLALFEGIIKCFLDNKNINEISFGSAKNLNKDLKEIPLNSTFLDEFASFKNSNDLAIVDGTSKLTYKELNFLSDNVAYTLLEKGYKKGDIAGILTNRNKNFIIYAIGALKAGLAYMPLDPSYPNERLEIMINTAKSKILLCDENLKNRLDFKGEVLYEFSEFSENSENSKVLENSKNSAILEFPKISLNDSFCILFTSGTTGTPKGIELTHKNVSSLCAWGKNEKLNELSSKHANFASFGFDAHLFDFYFTLSNGNCAYIIDENLRLDLNELKKYFESEKITSAIMTTQVAREFALTNPKHLKFIIAGGEILTPLNTPKNLRLYNGYGPAECAMMITGFIVDKKYKFNPIGKANPNTRIYLVDKFGRLAPSGALGEICIAGAQVSRGYINNAEKTKESFVPNNFEKIQGYETLYKTGDIARIMADGNYQILGRADKQVKIRGYRVELSEIEDIISSFEGIRENRVIAKTSKNGAKYLVSYIVSDKQIDIKELKHFISKSKPMYMVPSFILQIPKIPLTQNHKLDEKALPEPNADKKELKKPQTKLEKEIYKVVSDVLDIKDFSIDDDFSELGLSSILAMRLAVEISKDFSSLVNFSAIMEHKSVEKLANFIENLENKQEKKEKRKLYPLARNQLGIYTQCAMNPHNTIYNVPNLIKLPKSIKIDKLITALKEAINAHPYLKMQLVRDINGEVLAKRDDDLEVNVEIKEISKIDKRELVRPFELYSKPLYKIEILKLKKENYLFIDLHHIICDGFSANVLFDDIKKLYHGKKIEPETYTGFDIALDEELRANSDEFDKAKEFYAKLLSGREIDSLPIKDSQENKDKILFVNKTSSVDLARILEFCAKNNISKNSFFNAVFAYALSKFNANNEVLYTTIQSGRFDARVQRTISMLVKTFPMPVLIDENQNCVDFIEDISALLLENMSHEIYSFSHISHEYNIYADIIFNFDDENYDLFLDDKKLQREKLLLKGLKSKFDTLLSVDDDKLVFSIGFHADYYTKWLVGSFIELFEKIASEFVTKNCLKDVIFTKNQSFDELKEIPLNSTFLDNFANFKNSNDLAIVDSSSKLSYKELNFLSDNVAYTLLEKGYKKGDIAGILTNRNKNFIIYAIGALKAGLVYMPLDPSYPNERLEIMINTAKSKILLCDENLKNRLDFKGEVLFEFFAAQPAGSKNSRIPNKLEFPKVTLNDSFCILFTSGTTGTPKGIELTHKNVSSLCAWGKNEKLNELSPKHANFASFGFDAHLFDFYFTLSNGNCAYIIDENLRLDLNELKKYFEKEKITSAIMTTQVAREFALTNPKHLKFLFAGGEVLTPLNPPKSLRLYNGYGPAETTMQITGFIVDKKYKFNPIGKANPNTRIYLVDKFGRLAPSGALGEICIAGAQVSKGYINNAEKTKESFVSNNFEKIQGYETLYKTGDIARIMSDGNYQILGRADKQVKIRGYRVELSEIEDIISSFEDIKENRVIAKTSKNGAKYLVSYIVSDKQIDIKELKHFISKSKPMYMVPSFILQIPKIPLTQNHKLDEKALPEPLSAKKDFAMPINIIQNKLYDVLGEVLGHKNFGIDDNIFEVGLNSILASKFLIKCLNINVKLNYKDIFTHQSIEKLSKFVDNKVIVKLEKNKTEKILANNIITANSKIKTHELGVVLLTGANGFLGIHILKELVESGHKVLALIRSKDGKSGKERLKEYLEFYFNKSEFKNLEILEADITKDDIKADFDTLINAAASVKHFASDDSIERTNLKAARSAVKLCKERGARLIELSTTSIAGMSYNTPNPHILKENELEVGQWLNDNQYLQSKLKAEKIVLEAMKTGLKAKIIRVGNLMGRYSDGKFQINIHENSFLGRFRAYAAIGCFPMSRAGEMVEFSPVDSVAKAVIILAKSDEKYTLFHAYNDKKIPVWKTFSILNKKGIDVDLVNDEKYETRLDKIKYNDDKMEQIKELFAYSRGLNSVMNDINADFSVDILAKMGFTWKEIDEDYIERFLNATKKALFEELI